MALRRPELLGRLRTAWRAATARLRERGFLLVQAVVAAGLAWVVAHELLGRAQPFFAPISALIISGQTMAQRTQRAVELLVGVAVGILVADLLALALGTGTAQLVLIMGLAMALAVLVGGGTLLVTQAGVSAVLVVTLQPPQAGLAPLRAVDALVGGVLALAVSGLLPKDPLRQVRHDGRALLDALARTVGDAADALREGDRDAADAVLVRAGGLEPLLGRLREAVDAGLETTRLAPGRRRARPGLAPYAEALSSLDAAVRGVTVLGRGVRRALETRDRVPPAVPEALDELARAVTRVATWLEDPRAGADAPDAALAAAARATAILDQTTNLSVSAIVGQVRATAVDLLSATGVERPAAREAVRAAHRPAPPAPAR
ncbi:aromatic acid exporter family protein [Conexibacter sp. SYSU D00693]|uniref:FUSC family protein n=1 Tax=Conexibacter sp. SYSU D00693 TaxID=2812560 RepID=UPI00196A3D38|nr:FUSC family protein [Conexibacter sp. SYSU D00693]